MFALLPFPRINFDPSKTWKIILDAKLSWEQLQYYGPTPDSNRKYKKTALAVNYEILSYVVTRPFSGMSLGYLWEKIFFFLGSAVC